MKSPRRRCCRNLWNVDCSTWNVGGRDLREAGGEDIFDRMNRMFRMKTRRGKGGDYVGFMFPHSDHFVDSGYTGKWWLIYSDERN